MKLLLLLLLPCFVFSQPKIYFTNLALEGGGTRGVAYAGAFKVLEQKGILQNIENVAGSSAGAIAGLMICVGYNSVEIDSMLQSIPFQQFNDGGGGLIGKYRRIKKKYGIYKGDKFEDWLLKMVLLKTGNAELTFAQLHQLKLTSNKYRDLYCTGTNISRQRLEVFSYLRSPNMPIAKAVRISGGIPLYFTPIALSDTFTPIAKNDTSTFVNYFVDGGMLCNYPISMFDSCVTGAEPLTSTNLIFNKNTLGIKLERKEQIDSFLKDSTDIAPFTPKNIGDYLNAFGNLTTETMVRKYPNLANEKGRTIYIDFGNINPRIKKMPLKDKLFLIENGVKATEYFLQHLQN